MGYYSSLAQYPQNVYYSSKITGLQNKAVKLDGNSKRTDTCGPAYKNLGILQLHDLHIYETVIFMHKFHNNKLFLSFLRYFVQIAEIHSASTRSSTTGLRYYIPQYKKKTTPVFYEIYRCKITEQNT